MIHTELSPRSIKTHDLTLREERDLLPLPSGWEKEDSSEGPVYRELGSVELSAEHPLIREARVLAEGLPLPVGWTVEEADLEDGVRQSYYSYLPPLATAKHLDTAPRYLRFASPLTGWDHPLLRYKLSALVSAQGAAAQAYTLLQAEPCDPADVQSPDGGPIPLLDPAVVTAAAVTAANGVAGGGETGPVAPTIAEAPIANGTATGATGGGGGSAPEAPLQAVQALQEQPRPMGTQKDHTGTQKGHTQGLEDLRSPVLMTVAAPPTGAEGRAVQRQGSGGVDGPTPMPAHTTVHTSAPMSVPTTVSAPMTSSVVAPLPDRLPDRGVSFADPGTKPGPRGKADRPKGSSHMMQRQGSAGASPVNWRTRDRRMLAGETGFLEGDEVGDTGLGFQDAGEDRAEIMRRMRGQAPHATLLEDARYQMASRSPSPHKTLLEGGAMLRGQGGGGGDGLMTRQGSGGSQGSGGELGRMQSIPERKTTKTKKASEAKAAFTYRSPDFVGPPLSPPPPANPAGISGNPAGGSPAGGGLLSHPPGSRRSPHETLLEPWAGMPRNLLPPHPSETGAAVLSPSRDKGKEKDKHPLASTPPPPDKSKKRLPSPFNLGGYSPSQQSHTGSGYCFGESGDSMGLRRRTPMSDPSIGSRGIAYLQVTTAGGRASRSRDRHLPGEETERPHSYSYPPRKHCWMPVSRSLSPWQRTQSASPTRRARDDSATMGGAAAASERRHRDGPPSYLRATTSTRNKAHGPDHKPLPPPPVPPHLAGLGAIPPYAPKAFAAKAKAVVVGREGPKEGGKEGPRIALISNPMQDGTGTPPEPVTRVCVRGHGGQQAGHQCGAHSHSGGAHGGRYCAVRQREAAMQDRRKAAEGDKAARKLGQLREEVRGVTEDRAVLLARLLTPTGGHIVSMLSGDEPDALLERLAQFWGAALNSPMPLVQALFMAPPSGDHRAKLCRFLLHRLYHPLAVDPQAPATLLVAAVALQARISAQACAKLADAPRLSSALYLPRRAALQWAPHASPLSSLLLSRPSDDEEGEEGRGTLLTELLTALVGRHDVRVALANVLEPLRPLMVKEGEGDWTMPELFALAGRVLDAFLSPTCLRRLPACIHAACRQLSRLAPPTNLSSTSATASTTTSTSEGSEAVDTFLLDFLLLPALARMVAAPPGARPSHEAPSAAELQGHHPDVHREVMATWRLATHPPPRNGAPAKRSSLTFSEEPKPTSPHPSPKSPPPLGLVYVTWRLFRWASAVSASGSVDMAACPLSVVKGRQRAHPTNRRRSRAAALADALAKVREALAATPRKQPQVARQSKLGPCPVEAGVPTSRLQSGCQRYGHRLLGFRALLATGQAGHKASLSLDPSSPLSPRPLVVACLSDLRFLSFTLSRVSDMSDTRGGALAQRLLEAEAALAAFAENTERRRKPDAAYVFLLRLPYAASGRPPSPSAEHWRKIQPPPERREETEALRRSLARLRSERKALTTALKEREDRATPPKDRHKAPSSLAIESRPTGEETAALARQRLTQKSSTDKSAWDYRPLERGWRLGHSEWNELFTTNLRRPWPQHLSAPPPKRPDEEVIGHEGVVRQLLDIMDQKSILPPSALNVVAPPSPTVAAPQTPRADVSSPRAHTPGRFAYHRFETAMGALRSEGHEAVNRGELHSLPSTLLNQGRGAWASSERRDHHASAIRQLQRLQQLQQSNRSRSRGGTQEAVAVQAAPATPRAPPSRQSTEPEAPTTTDKPARPHLPMPPAESMDGKDIVLVGPPTELPTEAPVSMPEEKAQMPEEEDRVQEQEGPMQPPEQAPVQLTQLRRVSSVRLPAEDTRRASVTGKLPVDDQAQAPQAAAGEKEKEKEQEKAEEEQAQEQQEQGEDKPSVSFAASVPAQGPPPPEDKALSPRTRLGLTSRPTPVTIDEVTTEPPPLTPGRALLLAEGIDLDCLTRALKLDVPEPSRDSDALATSNTPAASRKPASRSASRSASPTGSSRRASYHGGLTTTLSSQLSDAGSGGEAPLIGHNRPLSGSLHHRRASMPGRAPEAAEAADEPTGAVDFLRSPAAPLPKRAIPGAEAGLHLTIDSPRLRGGQAASPSQRSAALSPVSVASTHESTWGAGSPGPSPANAQSDRPVSRGGSQRDWPVSGLVGADPEAMTYAELFRGLEVVKHKRLGRREARTLYLDPETQSVLLWRPPGMNKRHKAKKAFCLVDVKEIVKGESGKEKKGFKRLLGWQSPSKKVAEEGQESGSSLSIILPDRTVTFEMEDGAARDALAKSIELLRVAAVAKAEGQTQVAPSGEAAR